MPSKYVNVCYTPRRNSRTERKLDRDQEVEERTKEHKATDNFFKFPTLLLNSSKWMKTNEENEILAGMISWK